VNFDNDSRRACSLKFIHHLVDQVPLDVCLHFFIVLPPLFLRHLPLRTARGMELHDALFETLLGFVWGNPMGVTLGEVYAFAFAWIFGHTCIDAQHKRS
jgi:hypothetical protein